MTRLERLQAKHPEALYELENALDERDAAQHAADDSSVPTSNTGKLIKIGPRTCREGDTATVLRLWKAELQAARNRLRSLNAEIAKERGKQ